jgi:hypothetical protein
VAPASPPADTAGNAENAPNTSAADTTLVRERVRAADLVISLSPRRYVGVALGKRAVL